jgi:8-oxo-dGTP pyrophosphatase MutT (NUDIX family)
MTVPVARRAARILLLDGAGRVLLQHCCDPAAGRDRTWWNTPGGGLDEGESSAQAGARELIEETGLRLEADELGAVVHARITEFSFGGRAYRQSEEYFLVQVDAHDVAPTALSDLELVAVLAYRWWSREELRSTTEAVYPEELLEVLDRLVP